MIINPYAFYVGTVTDPLLTAMQNDGAVDIFSMRNNGFGNIDNLVDPANDATNSGLTLGTDYAQATASTQYAQFPTSRLTGATTFSVEFYFSTTTAGSRGNMLLLNKIDDSATAGQGSAFFVSDTNKFQMDFSNVPGINSFATVNDGSYHQGVIAFTGNKPYLYVDGILNADLTKSMTPSFVAAPGYFCRNANPGVLHPYQFIGLLSKYAAIYTSFLGPNTIQEHYRLSGLGGNGTVVYNDSCTDLSSWTNNGATVDTSNGNPSPCFSATGGKYAYKNVGITNNCDIEFDMYVIPGSTDLCDIIFGANAAGAGVLFRFDARVGEYSGFSTSSSWTSWNAPGNTSGYTGEVAGVFKHVKIQVRPYGIAAVVDGVAKCAIAAQTINGGYMGLMGDSSIVTGGKFDNIQIKTY